MRFVVNIVLLTASLMKHHSNNGCSAVWNSSLSCSPHDSEKSNLEEKCLNASTSLVENEKAFLDCLSDLNTNVLQHLLYYNSVDQKWDMHMKQVLQLNEKFHALWDQTGERCNHLKQLLHQSNPITIKDLYIVSNTAGVQELYIQYFSAFTNLDVVGGFDYLAKKTSNYWKKNKINLSRFFFSSEKPESSVSVSLYRVLHERIRDQVTQYILILKRLCQSTEKPTGVQEVNEALKGYIDLQSHISQLLDDASLTKVLWKSLGQKLSDILCTPERRLREDSKNMPISHSAGRFSHDRILLFDDVLVILQGSDVHCYDLTTVWTEETTEENSDRRVLKVITPEENFTLYTQEPQHEVVWQWKLNHAVRQCLNRRRDFPLWGKRGQDQNPSGPPLYRFAVYTFKNEGRLKNAIYEGYWNQGKPHGKGTLKWENERNYTGDFQNGQEHGFGVYVDPHTGTEGYDCYKCHWRDGKMHRYGICEYSNSVVYRGYFKDNLRHGFGILESSKTDNSAFRYVGHWKNDKKHGYGILESTDSGESYIGMWQEDHREGNGIVVTQSGLCYEGTFHCDKLIGKGVLLSEDNSLYEGEFTEDLQLKGKGKLTFSNGFTIEGAFSNRFGNGLQANGVLNTAGNDDIAEAAAQLQLGLHGLPVKERWPGIFEPFVEYLRAGSTDESEEAFLGFHTESGRSLRKAISDKRADQNCSEPTITYLASKRKCGELPVKNIDFIKDLKTLQDVEQIQKYLEKSFQSSMHPLGKLLQIQVFVFQATYSGMGANKHLVTMAQEEVKYHAEKILEIIMDYISLSLTGDSQDEVTRNELNCYSLVLPLILPAFYPELSMLYMLFHEKDDALYWQGIVHLGLLSDTKLLEFLDVQKHLWPLKDLHLTINQRYSLVKDQCFLSAIECFQKISTTADPREKMDTLYKTFEEIEKTVSRVLNQDYKLPMDDLLPLLVYVVSRARIRHLGAELHLIRDMMDPNGVGGITDFLLTALESCFQHIQKQEIRQGRFTDSV
ncbi:ALS2 C-terminal-like protein isoform X1 [Lepisosteus oculatus]|uniref:ALS2 C-terminal-like protein isoform X1 n=1 Tax=Lepisosteus oculatus TaxID=7918 RepID=UPI003718D522